MTLGVWEQNKSSLGFNDGEIKVLDQHIKSVPLFSNS
jgi:hypothetical protein